MKSINLKKIKKILACSIVLTNISTSAIAYEYKIQKGDTLSEISKNNYGTSSYYEALAIYNNIENPDFIVADSTIEIPSYEKLNIYVYDEFYEVKKGDTLSKLCKERYGTTKYVNKVATYNKKGNPDLIYVGEIIAFPNVKKLENIGSFWYTVKKDETLFLLAKTFYEDETLGPLLGEYNCLNSNNLTQNQQLFIPSYEQIMEFKDACYNVVGKVKTYVRKRNI